MVFKDLMEWKLPMSRGRILGDLSIICWELSSSVIKADGHVRHDPEDSRSSQIRRRRLRATEERVQLESLLLTETSV
ncbi:hypothetical protein CEXT_755091 [Caerostris extrusa]|uniref:Uncharacterized protein n=1 Tax=Caerostris extrusa TaxID=172846 RepID=A0AAV4UD66_CAEEX|nr:hypothetical protein CEXT_755091 [Caerostris extrusa]